MPSSSHESLQEQLDAANRRILELERLLAEKPAHGEGDHKFQALAMATREAVFLSEQGVCLDANNAASEMFGYTHDELIGIFGADVFAPESKDLVQSNMLSGYELAYEATGMRKNGERFPAEIQGKMFTHQGKTFRATTIRDLTTHKDALKKLKNSEECFLHIFQSVNSGMCRCSLDGTFIDVNAKLSAITGRAEHELRGKRLQDIVFPDDLKDLNTHLDSLRAGAGFVAEIRFFSNTGEPSWVLLSASLSPMEHQGAPTFIAVVEDISASKAAEGKMLKKEQRLRSIFEHSPSGMALIDTQGALVDCNDLFLEHMGASRESLIGFNAARHASSWAMRKAIKDALGGKQSIFEDEYTSVTGGKTSQLRAVFNPVDPENPPCRIIATFEDVTERKLAEKALIRSERKWRHVLKNIPQIGVTLDTTGRIIFANDHLLELSGWTADEIVGENWFDIFIPAEISDEVKEVFTTTMAIKDVAEFSTYENEIVDKAGRKRMIAWSNVLSKNAAGAVVDVTCMGVDLTDRLQTQDKLVQAKEAAEAASMAKSEFLATMSHEIRTPLNGIMGMLQLVKNTSLNDEQNSYVSIALESSANLLRILSDVLDLSRIESGALEIEWEEFDILSAVQPVVGSFLNEAARKNITLGNTIEPDVPMVLQGDEGRIRQMLFNLVGNAVKYTEQGSVQIEVYSLPVAPGPGEINIHFVVSDTGIGISDAKLKRIWEPFTQGDGATNREFGGAGLGLSIVRRLVRMMGGTLSIWSEEQQGTEIHITLPMKLPTPQRAAGDIVSVATTDAPNRRILLVEDDDVNRLTLKTMLLKQGYEVLTAGNGREALDVLDKEEVNLILMDIQMPEMNGVEATKYIRGAESEIAAVPIVAMTAYALSGDREQFLNAGMNDYISKPVDMNELHGVVEGLLG